VKKTQTKNSAIEKDSDCMRPKKPTEQEVDKALDIAIETRQKQLHILTQPEPKLVKPMCLSRKKALFKLRRAIGEVLWQDACEKF